MSAFLTVTSAALDTIELDIDADSAHEGEPDTVGDTSRSFNGPFLSDVVHKRRFEFVAVNLFPVDYAALRNMVKNDAPVTIAGDALGAGVTLVGILRITDAPFFDDARADEGHSRSASLTFLED